MKMKRKENNNNNNNDKNSNYEDNIILIKSHINEYMFNNKKIEK